MDCVDQMNVWMKQWEKAQQHWAKEEKRHAVQTSFFNDLPMDNEYVEHDPSQEEIEDWIDIYNRSLEQSDDNVINEDYRPKKKRRKLDEQEEWDYTNPQRLSGLGPDQGEYDEPIRVSKRAAATSPELEKLDEFKRKIEVLERRAHRAEVMGESSKKTKLKNELKSLRRQVHELSDMLQARPDDVT